MVITGLKVSSTMLASGTGYSRRPKSRRLTAQLSQRIGWRRPADRWRVDDYASFTLPAGWGESSFTVSFSCTHEDFGSTDIDGYHYLFGHALTSQNGDIGFKAQTVPDAQQIIWAFSDDDGGGASSLLSGRVLEPDAHGDAFTLVFDRDSPSQRSSSMAFPLAKRQSPPPCATSSRASLSASAPSFSGGNLQHFHQGAFADVHFFPAALTEAEIHSLIQECTPPDIPLPIGA